MPTRNLMWLCRRPKCGAPNLTPVSEADLPEQLRCMHCNVTQKLLPSDIEHIDIPLQLPNESKKEAFERMMRERNLHVEAMLITWSKMTDISPDEAELCEFKDEETGVLRIWIQRRTIRQLGEGERNLKERTTVYKI